MLPGGDEEGDGQRGVELLQQGQGLGGEGGGVLAGQIQRPDAGLLEQTAGVHGHQQEEGTAQGGQDQEPDPGYLFRCKARTFIHTKNPLIRRK